MDEYGVPCSKEGATLGYFLRTMAVNGKYAHPDIPRWDHKDFKVFPDDILQLVQVIYILYLYECKYQNFYDIFMIVRFILLNIIVGEILVSTRNKRMVPQVCNQEVEGF